MNEDVRDDLSASEAARILGISLPTLYAYVSRGLLAPTGTQPAAQPGARSKRYPREAVLRLAARKADGKRGGHQAAASMHWGVPVLETRIGRIADGRLYYRGHDALALAEHATLETVATILWDDARHDRFGGAASLPAGGAIDAVRALAHGMPPLARAAAAMPVLAHAVAPHSACASSLLDAGPYAMRMLAAVLLDAEPDSAPLHDQVGRAWGADAVQCDLIRAALVLLADHELNASAFTVRCVAATGASLGAVLGAGLAALSGPRHGGGSASVTRLFGTAAGAPSPGAAVDAWFAADGAARDGFGHPLYPDGDPRAAHVLARLARTAPPQAASLIALCTAAGVRRGMLPNMDFALAALQYAFGWPPSAAVTLFALARSAGWIAHAAEQAADPALIRPRARYVGRF